MEKICYYRILGDFKTNINKHNLHHCLIELEEKLILLLLQVPNYIEFLKLKALIDKSLNTYLYKFLLEKHINKSIHCDLTTIYGRFIINNKQNNKLSNNIYTNLLYRTQIWGQEYINKYGKIFHILTDIDDTLYPAKETLSGSDCSWKKGNEYPGIVKFYQLIYNSNHYKSLDRIFKYSTILSATPNCHIPAIGDKRKERIMDKTISKILGEYYSFLHGKDSLIESIMDICYPSKFSYTLGSVNSPHPISIANTKLIRYNFYSMIFPEYQFCFIGDNGQGDMLVGEHIIKSNIDNIACIHNILENNTRRYDKTKIQDIYNNKSIQNIEIRLFIYNDYLELGYYFYKILNIFSHQSFNRLYRDIYQIVKKEIETNIQIIENIKKIRNIEYYQLFIEPREIYSPYKGDYIFPIDLKEYYIWGLNDLKNIDVVINKNWIYLVLFITCILLRYKNYLI